jgi:hypothetical protein
MWAEREDLEEEHASSDRHPNVEAIQKVSRRFGKGEGVEGG